MENLISLCRQTFTIHDAGYLVRNATGQRAGCNDAKGYRVVMIGGKTYKEHRLIWLMVYGREPSGPIDHINRIKSDNRPSNLRESDSSLNAQNLGLQKNSRTGMLGVSIDPSSPDNPYRAKIKHKGKQISLGSYATPEEAQSAYLAAKRQLHAACAI